ncbi:acyl carrier protein [Streptacidiphilus sp. PB12-B1b]|uniref:acyl carrier protein n=1 Tax=Streptacidiphilus sp. PB12-B1b TaxID=2705012 RepID=UPI0015FBB588|nr:acyl carrier protein [Streptacidiphilus sp. PB12-B1b]QMU77044.1 acyl carrier protein [Streptacidiphilus sp. PB12-B1b]
MSAAEAAHRPATQGEIEQWVIGLCRELGLTVEGAASDFFAAGGTSLQAMRLIAAAEERFGEDALPPDDLYEHSALGEIASVILKSAPAAGPDAG